MEGMSQSKRNMYFYGLVLVFLISAPLIALYATGYRISSDLELIETGGIHVDVQRSGASFFLDDSFEGEGTLFQKSFFVQNLKPGTHSARVEKEGYFSWEKQLEVFPTVITEARSLLILEEPKLTAIARTIERVEEETEDGTRISRPVPNPAYEAIFAVFNATSTDRAALTGRATTAIQYNGTSTTVYLKDSIGLWHDDTGLHAWWLNGEDELPYAFCRHNECERHITVWDNPREIRHFDFLPKDNLFILLERRDGIYVTEVDTRAPQNTFPLYPREGARMHVVDNRIYILDDATLFELKL